MTVSEDLNARVRNSPAKLPLKGHGPRRLALSGEPGDGCLNPKEKDAWYSPEEMRKTKT